jgi:hypothetical protein
MTKADIMPTTMPELESTGEPVPDDVSALLRAWTDGGQRALARLTPIVCDELHRLAHYYLKREHAGHSLQTTALVNEAYMRLVDYKRMQRQNRAHFMAAAAQATAEVLRVSPITVMRGGKSAKAWLYRELTGPATNGQ